MDIRESVSMLLSARVAAYRSLQVAFASEPTAGYVSSMSAAGDVFSVFAGDEGELASYIEDWQRVASGLAGDDAALKRVADAYCGLFVGPGPVAAAPWESVHTGTDRALFQRSTLDVRKAYVAQELIPQGYPHVADDHVALELDFMCRMAERMASALDAGDVGGLRDMTAASLRFLDDHLVKWVPSFRAALEAASGNAFYVEAVRVLDLFVALDGQALGEIGEALEGGAL